MQIHIILNEVACILAKEKQCCQGLECSVFHKELRWICLIEYLNSLHFMVYLMIHWKQYDILCIYCFLWYLKCLNNCYNFLFCLSDVLEGEIFLQNLPSIVAAHALGTIVNYTSCCFLETFAFQKLCECTCMCVFLNFICVLSLPFMWYAKQR